MSITNLKYISKIRVPKMYKDRVIPVFSESKR